MGYYLFDQAKHEQGDAHVAFASLDDDALASLLSTGSAAQRQAALRVLIERGAEAALTRCVGSDNSTAARLAINGLWECWLNEQGIVARAQMDAGVEAMNDGNLTGAAEIFNALILEYPTWAEVVNKLATVLYLQGVPDKSIALCRVVVEMKPDHFGAWNGMALCAIQTENWVLAFEAVQQSLRLQPRSATNLQLLKLVQSRLPDR